MAGKKERPYKLSDRIIVEHDDGRQFGISAKAFEGGPLEKEGFRPVAFENGQAFETEQEAAPEPAASGAGEE